MNKQDRIGENMQRRVVITGIDVITPLGAWRLVLEDASAAADGEDRTVGIRSTPDSWVFWSQHPGN